MTHTPGPWHIECREDDLVRFSSAHTIGGKPNVAIWADGEHAASGFFREIALVAQDDMANAALIAAAPETAAELDRLRAVNVELLAALKRNVQWVGKLIADGGHINAAAPNAAVYALAQGEAAIARAEGR